MTPHEAFFALYEGLDRQGPGSRASLDWALGLAGVGPSARLLDAGCGPGADVAGLLAWVPQGRVVALDRHGPFIDRMRARFAAEDRVEARQGDMAAPEGAFDLIWAAGSVYVLGVAAALAAWRGHLAPGGRVAFSQLAWRGGARPEPAAAFWAAAYPAMTEAEGVLEDVAAAGYRSLGRRWLSAADWAAYYEPLAARCVALRPEAERDGALAGAIAAAEAEIATWRAAGDSYGYLLCVVAPE